MTTFDRASKTSPDLPPLHDLAKEALIRGEIVTTQQAAEILGLSDERVKQFAQEGRIGTKIGRAFLFTRTELAEFSQIERKNGRPANS